MNKHLKFLPAFILIACSCSRTPMYTVKVREPEKVSLNTCFKMGTATNPIGKSILVNKQGMLFDGVPTIPVMGEIHYSRCPESEWRKELLKMKAGGITVVATYAFWIHHEEEEGVYNWSGERNLRRFTETCKEVGLPLVLRIGPWCHGEARNGGFPEWLVKSGMKLRNNNPEYMEKVRIWYTQLFKQVEGLMWKDGGPVIGVQIENEFRGDGNHLLTLKKMAQEIGLDAPFYTRTGWPKLTRPIPFGEILPLYGDYADGFWDRTVNEMPGDYGKSYLFRSFRNSTVIATEQLPKQSDKDNPDDIGYPYFTCELGGGMMTSYHRRIVIQPMDIYSMSLVRVGSGSNLPGYYMYHGGTNPVGKLSTLNETQVSLLTNHNDLPVKTYDFQAPLGEFGQINPHYHMLRLLHQFLQDFGSDLFQMPASFPTAMQADFKTDSLLRWSVRSNGESGFVFVNNYQRLKELQKKSKVRFTIGLSDGTFVFPDKPLTVQPGTSFILPFNMNLGGINMVYSTAQPVARLAGKEEEVYVFTRINGINPDFVFDAANVQVESSSVKPRMSKGRISFEGAKSGTNATIRLKVPGNKTVSVLLLDEATALSFWKGELAGQERLFITNSELTYDRNRMELTDDARNNFSVSIFPKLQSLKCEGTTVEGKTDGIFTNYQLNRPELSELKVTVDQVKEVELPMREITIGAAKVAQQPDDADFDKAAVWKIKLPANVDPSRDLYLQIPYIGDVARLYLNGKLLTDNFYNGRTFELGMKRFSPDIYKEELLLKILPLRKESPIYLPVKGWNDWKDGRVELPGIKLKEKYTFHLEAM